MSEQTSTDDKQAARGEDSSEGTTRQDSDERRRPRRTAASESPRRSSAASSSKSRPVKSKASSTTSSATKAGATKSSAPKASTAKSEDTKTASEPARVSTVQAVKKAVEQFSALTGRSPESVVGARWVDDHWAVRLEVVESRRVPNTADLLAEYDIQLDGQGELLEYGRQNRYVRGRPSE
ncbi:gas vesicle protein GvpO [Brevibacterium sp. RIT 803]|uniref:gas vesicle protein GvpO n=1 Tax=Brevibacterium sp. RIT 803 TaxID=2810210 RepID=UPI00194F77E5|nr:gas vesicle protein GvpO [Brevibacterium sp. RIT 803]MBM6589132.1 gas vesicle protein [Brevibacterium sp. RIT 803]